MKNILTEKVNGKYQLDLWRANEAILLGAGILKEHLSMTDICTCLLYTSSGRTAC